MPCSALHTVEMQLVMQLCELAEVMRLARCCRLTQQAAAAEFAFRHTPPIELCSLQTNLTLIFRKSLARFSPRLNLRMLSTKGTSEAEYTAFLAMLKSAPPLHGFDCMSMPQLHLDPLLSTSALRSLRVLSLRHDVPFDGTAIQSLNHLRDLTVQCGPHWRILTSLAALDSLISLTVEFTTPDSHEPLPAEAFAAVGECLSLQSLTIRNIPASMLQRILSSRMQSLTSLTLLDLRLANPPLMQFEPPSWCACLSSPPQLRRIEFVRFATLRKLLHHLTSTLDSRGPLRAVLFHPRVGAITGAGPAFIREFLQRFVLLDSVELEMPRVVPHRPTLSQASYPSFCLRSRVLNLDRYASREMVELNRHAFEKQLQELMIGDERVSIAECAAVVPREDVNRSLLERFAPKQRGCIIA